MAVLNQDTRLIMTILFVGAVSGANVYAYAEIGTGFPYGALAHSVLFGLGTIGAIMVMKALFDLALNDKIELWLLDRKITAFGKERLETTNKEERWLRAQNNITLVCHIQAKQKPTIIPLVMNF